MGKLSFVIEKELKQRKAGLNKKRLTIDIDKNYTKKVENNNNNNIDILDDNYTTNNTNNNNKPLTQLQLPTNTIK